MPAVDGQRAFRPRRHGRAEAIQCTRCFSRRLHSSLLLQTPAPPPGARRSSRRRATRVVVDFDLVRRRDGGTVQGQGAGLGRELPRLRDRRLLSGHHLPPRGERLRGPGRRLHRDHGREADAPADPERGHQRAAQPPRHGRHGAHPEPAQRHVAVLLQRLQQRRTSITSGFSPRDFGYAVFGRVLSGMDVVDRIAAVPTHATAGHGRRAGRARDHHRRQGRPLTPEA